MQTETCKKCGRQRAAEDLEEWDDSLELLCFGEEDPLCVAPTKFAEPDDG